MTKRKAKAHSVLSKKKQAIITTKITTKMQKKKKLKTKKQGNREKLITKTDVMAAVASVASIVDMEVTSATKKEHATLLKAFDEVSSMMPEHSQNNTAATVAATVEVLAAKSNHGWANSTKKTKTDLLMGALGRRKGLKPDGYNGMDGIHKINATERTKKFFTQESNNTKRATPITQNIVANMDETPEDLLLIAVAMASCTRMGNMVAPENSVIITNETVSVILNKHKTKKVIGKLQINLPRNLPLFLSPRIHSALQAHNDKEIKFQQTTTHIAKILKKYNLTMHSCRRGGILMHRQRNVPLEEIAVMTGHTTLQGLMRYADDVVVH